MFSPLSCLRLLLAMALASLAGFAPATDDVKLHMVKDINAASGTAVGNANPRYLGEAGGLAYFAANDGQHGEEPWVTDGTAAGTRLLKDLNPGSSDSLSGYSNPATPPVVPEFTRLGNKAFFSATTLVKDISIVNGYTYYYLISHLWRSDGTTSGTEIIKYDPTTSQFPNHLTPFNDKVFFIGYDLGAILGVDAVSTTAREYYQTNSYYLGSAPVMPLGQYLLFFGAYAGSKPEFLMRTDGTMAGTVPVKRFLAEGVRSPYKVSSEMVNVNGQAYFFITYAADNGTLRQTQLWKSDGWPGNTQAIQAIPAAVSAPASVPFYSFTSARNRLFFKAIDEQHGNELWVSDGTSATTHLVKDITPGPASTTFGGDIEMGEILFFVADDGVHGAELWRTDGTESGTAMVQDLNPGAAGSNPVIAGVVNGALLVAADDGAHGRELWMVGGLNEMTPLAEINPNGSANPRNFYKTPQVLGSLFGQMLYFCADDGTHGEELWRTDGTAGGTTLVGDINPGAGAAAPEGFFTLGDQLLFSADDGSHGRELWSFSEHVTAAQPGWRKYE